MILVKRPLILGIVIGGLIGISSAAEETGAAASVDERVAAIEKALAEMRAAYEARIAELERQIADLKTTQAAAEAAAPAQATAPPPRAASSMTSTYFNPAISVIGNFLGVGGSNTTENLPNADLREAELGLQAIVDPYARADFFLSFPEDGVEIEEGYVQFTALPARFLAKVGRMRASFGKINTLHLHTLPWPDSPLTLVNLVGGEEGWIGTGVSVGKILPLGDVFSELTVQAFRGDSENLFDAPGRSELAYNAHYRVFHDLTEATNLDVGLSYGFGPNGVTEAADTTLQGVDLTFRWKPLQTATYRSLTARAEYIRSRREQIPRSVTAGGWFLSADYQLARRWFVGARFEIADHADDSTVHDSGQAATLTFWPSEFAQLRGELRRRLYAGGETADEILFQLQFAIGAHGAHPF